MSQVIIIEGPDGAGKTHLAARLMLRDYAYRHEGPTPEGVEALRYYGDKLHRALAEERDIVFDRFHLGAYVYGPIYRRRIELTAEELTVMDRLTRSRPIRLIIALPRWSLVLANWMTRRRHEMIKNERQLLRVYEAFERLVKDRGYETWSYEDNAALTAYDRTRGPAQDVLGSGVTGTPRPKYLFVGEAPNAPFEPAFFSMRGCSGYLNRAVWRAGYREEEIAFVNALDHNGGRAYDDAIVKFVERSVKRIITLGRVAQRVVNDLGVNNVEVNVPHPQYWKRFHHHDVRGYVKLLKEARL